MTAVIPTIMLMISVLMLTDGTSDTDDRYENRSTTFNDNGIRQ